MLKVTKNQLKQVKKWRLNINPYKAVNDYNELKAEQRWENSEHTTEFYKNFKSKIKIKWKNSNRIKIRQCIRRLSCIFLLKIKSRSH